MGGGAEVAQQRVQHSAGAARQVLQRRGGDAAGVVQAQPETLVQFPHLTGLTQHLYPKTLPEIRTLCVSIPGNSGLSGRDNVFR